MAERQDLVERLRFSAKRHTLPPPAVLHQAASQIESDQRLRAVVEGLVEAGEPFAIGEAPPPRSAEQRRLYAALKQAKEAMG